MKIECLKEAIDLNKIHYGINCFRKEHYGDYPSYIIMNYKTGGCIKKDNFYMIYDDSLIRKERLFDIPVAYNEELEFGEVDII